MRHARAHRTALGVVSLAILASSAFAGPPSLRHASARPMENLDLRPPATLIAPTGRPSDRISNAFPSALHRQTLETPQTVPESSLPSLGMQTRAPNRLEEFARRVHREGLPVARLWENKSALVSLGLSPKGKPGLWLVQKMH